MNERLHQLRKALKLNQEVFGEKLGISKSAVSNMEAGRYNITDTLIKLACQNFNANEDWLRTGNGDMFITVPIEELDKLAERYKLSGMAKRFVKTFVELDEKEMKSVLNFMAKVVTVDDEISATIELNEEPSHTNKWESETDRAQAILDAQKLIDSKYNKNEKKGLLSS